MSDGARSRFAGMNKKIRAGARLHWQFLGGSKRRIFIGRIQDFDTFTFLLESKKIIGESIHPQVGQLIKFYFQADDGLYEFETPIVEILPKGNDLSPGPILKMKMPKEGWRVQRRNFFRLQMHTPINYRLLKIDLSQNLFSPTPRTDWQKGLLCDLSGGGMQICLHELCLVGDIVEVQLKLQPEENRIVSPIYIQLVRAEEIDEIKSDFHYRYGSSFYQMSQEDRDKVIRYLHFKQMQQLKRD